MPWPLPYILVIGSFLLASFLMLGTVLLLRMAPRKRHRGPGSIATPLGYQSYWTEETRKLAAPGVERARRRDYAGRGRG